MHTLPYKPLSFFTKKGCINLRVYPYIHSLSLGCQPADISDEPAHPRWPLTMPHDNFHGRSRYPRTSLLLATLKTAGHRASRFLGGWMYHIGVCLHHTSQLEFSISPTLWWVSTIWESTSWSSWIILKANTMKSSNLQLRWTDRKDEGWDLCWISYWWVCIGDSHCLLWSSYFLERLTFSWEMTMAMSQIGRGKIWPSSDSGHNYNSNSYVHIQNWP